MNIKILMVFMIIVITGLTFGCIEEKPTEVVISQPVEIKIVEEPTEEIIVDLPDKTTITRDFDYRVVLEDNRVFDIPLCDIFTENEVITAVNDNSEDDCPYNCVSVSISKIVATPTYDYDKNVEIFVLGNKFEDYITYDSDNLRGYKLNSDIYDDAYYYECANECMFEGNIPLNCTIYCKNPYILDDWFIAYDLIVTFQYDLELK